MIDYSVQNKKAWVKASSDTALRKHLVEEMADVLMFYNDIMEYLQRNRNRHILLNLKIT